MDSSGSRSVELEATKPGNGARTSSYYRTQNIPERFDNPVSCDVQSSTGENSQTMNNLGNPVFSCPRNINNVIGTAQTSTLTASEDVFQGYNAKTQHPMYMTSAMEYGSRQPTVHTMPTMFHAKNQKFSEHLGTCGMYRDHSLNTAMDKSVV